ncbi:hypothetical protein LTR08_007245 [Meristemomyces frigidus]|nr:hypothetical protein LTR08_007245 [Meristemomyces frigidus]
MGHNGPPRLLLEPAEEPSNDVNHQFVEKVQEHGLSFQQKDSARVYNAVPAMDAFTAGDCSDTALLAGRAVRTSFVAAAIATLLLFGFTDISYGRRAIRRVRSKDATTDSRRELGWKIAGCAATLVLASVNFIMTAMQIHCTPRPK